MNGTILQLKLIKFKKKQEKTNCHRNRANYDMCFGLKIFTFKAHFKPIILFWILHVMTKYINM